MLATSWWGLLATALSLLRIPQLSLAQDTTALPDDRSPALYTSNYGDCQGSGSLIDVTRFDAAYYADNLTVVFDLEGTTQLDGVAIMMFIGVFAYGESRFDLIFNPCNANIASACPLNSSLPLRASDAIHVNPSDVADIPDLAYSIPDFEGEAILRIFSNATHEQIGCFAGVVTNGNSFSQPQSVGSVLGIFTFVALIASFATAIYGEAIPTMRLHYAHSLSVGVVFAVWQHIFFTGALSVNWPSVLVAWWSNFAWAGGMISTQAIQNSINSFIGDQGDPIAVGAAGSGTNNPSLGGSNALSLIYSRSLASGMQRAANHPLVRDVASEIFSQPRNAAYRTPRMPDYAERSIEKRDSSGSSPGFHYTGHEVPPGLPLPGNFSGFAGTLAQEDIAASNAFLTGFLWFLILLIAVTAAVAAFKWLLEGLSRIKWIKKDRLMVFRRRWIAYTAAIALRTCYLAFFMIMFLAIFQFTYQGSTGVNGIAAVVFIIFLLGIPGVALYACLYKLTGPDEPKVFNNLSIQRELLFGRLPWFALRKAGVDDHGPAEVDQYEEDIKKGPFWKRTFSRDKPPFIDSQTRSIHDDEDFIIKFGWLAARFRRTRWWFFGVWLIYEFLRAVFYAGASGNALVQVFALLVVELIAFVFLLWARPFEGQRLNVIVIYCLSVSKILSVALSAAFDVQFNIPRITTTAIGIVLIVIQGILTIITVIAIVVGAISSYMSVLRNREDFRPRRWVGHRDKYFDHLDKAVQDLPHQPKPKREKPMADPEPEVPVEPHFEMSNFRRMAKIEDDGDANSSTAAKSVNSRAPTPSHSRPGSAYGVHAGSSRSRAASMQSDSQLPHGARAHRLSWTMGDLEERSPTPVNTSRKVEDEIAVPEPTPPVSAKQGLGRMSSRNFRRSSTRLSAVASNEEPAEEKKQESFEGVPAPTMRPRAGTIGSRPASRAASFHITLPEEEPPLSSTEEYGGGRRPRPPLTPAQEAEEFTISPTKHGE